MNTKALVYGTNRRRRIVNKCVEQRIRDTRAKFSIWERVVMDTRLRNDISGVEKKTIAHVAD